MRPVYLTRLESQVSKLANSDTCPRPTAQAVQREALKAAWLAEDVHADYGQVL